MRRIIIITVIIFINFIIPSVYAADSTPSADIKAKLEELKKEIASKAAKLKLEVNKKLKDKAFIGKVKQKNNTILNLNTKNGPKEVKVNQDTQYDSNVKKKTYSQKNTTEDDYIAALGDVDDTGVLIAREIVLLPTPETKSKTFLWGQLMTSSADKIATLRDRNLKSSPVSLPNNSTAKASDFVILTGSFGKNDIFEAEFVYVIPKGGILRPKKIATPSAKISSPSAKPISR